MKKTIRLLFVGVLGIGTFALGTATSALPDPLAPASTGGLEAVDRALAKLSAHRRLLVVGAHPDDEDTSVLALISRAQGGDAAYLSLNRGEGGQNLIGTELGTGLGLVRSRELESARKIDGARQFFTRAYDFGYTRSLEETFQRWPRAELLEDALRVVRRFKPQVIVSVFPPDSRAGHGQHQAAAVVAQEVFRLAADPEVATVLASEGLGPWKVEALYRSGFFDRGGEALRVPIGVVDPLDGRSVIQLALASRSQHRSQDMGSLQELGGRDNRLIPMSGSAGVEGNSPFAGIDTRLAALASSLPAGELRSRLEARLERVQGMAEEARRQLSAVKLEAAAVPLGQILGELRSSLELLGEAVDPASSAGGVAVLLREKVAVAQEALAAAAGLGVDAYGDREALVPGEGTKVVLKAWNSGGETISVRAVELVVPEGWAVGPSGGGSDPSRGEAAAEPSFPEGLAAGALGTWERRVELPREAEASVPYFLRQATTGDFYDWSTALPMTRGTPFDPPFLRARFALTVAGQPLEFEREVVFRGRDQAFGEVRRPLRVSPRLEVSVSEELLVWPLPTSSGAATDPAAGAARTVEVEVKNNQETAAQGELRVVTPKGWKTVAPSSFALPPGGRRHWTIPLRTASSLEPGEHRISFSAELGSESYDRSLPLVEYPHVRPTALPRPAQVRVRVGPLNLPAVGRVGYIRGASDRVPEALKQIGLPVQELTPETLALEDLSVFDVIVVGSRAYETNVALGRSNDRLLSYVRGGGRLVVQYQQYQFVRGEFAPFPLDIARPHGRVTDEGATVRILEPDHPVLTTPNRIHDGDWESWVQERGLYFPSTWDDAYMPLLAMADPGGEELRGSILVAGLGEGTYIYTGLAFFRQLPAGVLGGYRLFLNLLQPELSQ